MERALDIGCFTKMFTLSKANNNHKHKMQNKELQDEFRLNLYDYHAMLYDPALGRWMNIDPLAEIARRWSPYTYAYNNPIYFIDPDGMMGIPAAVTEPSASLGGFEVATYGKDDKLIDLKFVDNLDGIGVGLDGNVYTNNKDLQTTSQGIMRDVLNSVGINPDAQPQQDLSEIDMLVEKVPELARLNKEGGNPNFDIRLLDPGEMGRYDHPSRTAFISPNAFSSYLYLAFTVGHELSHAVHFHSGFYIKWINYKSNGVLAREYSEYLARRWERDWGNPDASGYMKDHLKNIGGHINNLKKIK